MMKNFLILVLATSFLMSCESVNKEVNNQEKSTQIDEQEHEVVMEAIELDNGKKWRVDVGMLKIIRRMEASIQANKSTSKADLDRLAESLQDEIEELTSNCTMSGKAHDELHKWLVPYMELVDHLSESETQEQAASTFAQLKKSFTTFNECFE